MQLKQLSHHQDWLLSTLGNQTMRWWCQPTKLNHRLLDKVICKLGIFADSRHNACYSLWLMLLPIPPSESPLRSLRPDKMGEILLMHPALSFGTLLTSTPLAFSFQSSCSHFGLTSLAPQLGAPSSNWGLTPPTAVPLISCLRLPSWFLQLRKWVKTQASWNLSCSLRTDPV